MVFGIKKCLLKVEGIRDFEPQTDNENPMERKTALLNRIKPLVDLEVTKKRCENKVFSLKVIYYLNESAANTGKYEKDLDNMTKIVCDVLTDYLSNEDKVRDNKNGLGIMRDDLDIHELHLIKKFVKSDPDQGLDLYLYKYDDKKINSKADGQR